jgi:cytochrome c oxidase subunit 3
MRPRPRIDVSALPTTVFGPKAPLWWGAAGLLSIETTLFALMFATYYYLRGNESVWPPGGGSHGGPPIGPATVGLFLLLVSVVPMALVHRQTGRRSLRGIRFWLVIATLAGLLALVARVAEFGELPFRWDHHAYGSVVWTLIGLHAIHLLTASIENVMFVTLLFKGPVEEKHLLDLRLNAGYWYFVVGWWVVTYAVIYLDPGVFRT